MFEIGETLQTTLYLLLLTSMSKNMFSGTHKIVWPYDIYTELAILIEGDLGVSSTVGDDKLRILNLVLITIPNLFFVGASCAFFNVAQDWERCQQTLLLCFELEKLCLRIFIWKLLLKIREDLLTLVHF